MSLHSILRPHSTPLLYVKSGGKQGISIFLILDSKHRLWVLIRTESARQGGSNVYHQSCFEQKIRKISKFYQELFFNFFTAEKISVHCMGKFSTMSCAVFSCPPGAWVGYFSATCNSTVGIK